MVRSRVLLVSLTLLLAASQVLYPVPSEGQPHHTLKITGAAKAGFLALLIHCTKEDLVFDGDGETVVDNGNLPGPHYASLRDLKDRIIASGKTVVIDAVAGPDKTIDVDKWEPPAADTINGKVDMSDIGTFPSDVAVDNDSDGTADCMAVDGTWKDTNSDGIPDTPDAPPDGRFPHANTKCTWVAHILGERLYSVENPDPNPCKLYDKSHDVPAPGPGAIGADNNLGTERWRDATHKVTVMITKKEGLEHGDLAAGGHRDGVTSYDDPGGSEEIAHIEGANGEMRLEYKP